MRAAGEEKETAVQSSRSLSAQTHAFHKCFLRAYYVPGTDQDARTQQEQQTEGPALLDQTVSQEENIQSVTQ